MLWVSPPLQRQLQFNLGHHDAAPWLLHDGWLHLFFPTTWQMFERLNTKHSVQITRKDLIKAGSKFHPLPSFYQSRTLYQLSAVIKWLDTQVIPRLLSFPSMLLPASTIRLHCDLEFFIHLVPAACIFPYAAPAQMVALPSSFHDCHSAGLLPKCIQTAQPVPC